MKKDRVVKLVHFGEVTSGKSVSNQDLALRVGRTVRRWLRSKKLGIVAINLPYVLREMGAFDALIAESEANAREMLRIVESVRPCVLWMDELENGS